MKLFLIIGLLLGPICHSKEYLNLLSYNVGLAYGFVPYAKQRKPLIYKALSKTDADIVCLQELWEEQDNKDYIWRLRKAYPYSNYKKLKNIRERGFGASCKRSDLFGKNKFVSCIMTTCKGKTGEEGDRCVREDCRSSLDNLAIQNPSCAQALMASVGKNKILAILSLINPMWKASKFSNKGKVGTLILSKYPIVESGFLDMHEYSTTVRRGILFSKIRVGQKDILVTCNHLTANLTASAPYIGSPPYKGPLKFKNKWANENYFQIQKLLELSNDISTLYHSKYSQNILPLFHMGDFNCSLKNEKRKIFEDFPQSCQLMLKNGYTDYTSLGLNECTYCSNNKLTKEKKSYILDHIYSKNISPIGSKVEIKFKELIKVREKRTKIQSNLSDHFGVMVRIPLRNL